MPAQAQNTTVEARAPAPLVIASSLSPAPVRVWPNALRHERERRPARRTTDLIDQICSWPSSGHGSAIASLPQPAGRQKRLARDRTDITCTSMPRVG